MHPVLQKIAEIVTVVFISGVKFIFGLGSAFMFDMGFVPSVLLTIAGGMAGVFLFSLMDRIAVKYFKRFRKHKIKKVRFTRTKRWIVKVKSKYGLAGIAFLTPILLQVPVGTIMAMRLIKDVRKVSIAMLISFTFFSLLLSGLYYGFSVDFRASVMHIIGR